MPILNYQSRPKRPRLSVREPEEAGSRQAKRRDCCGQTRVNHETNTCSFDQCKMHSNGGSAYVTAAYLAHFAVDTGASDPYTAVAVLFMCISRVKRREEEISSVLQEEKRKKMIIYKVIKRALS